MSQHDFNQGRKDAENGKPLGNLQNAHWKTRQDTEAGHAAGKKEQK